MAEVGWFDEAYIEFLSHNEDELAEIITKAAEPFVEGLSHKYLRFIAWELVEKNIGWVQKVKREYDPQEGIPIGVALIVHQGFTTNQKRWLSGLSRALGERGGDEG